MFIPGETIGPPVRAGAGSSLKEVSPNLPLTASAFHFTVRFLSTYMCFFPSVTMKDTRLTALETEVPIVPRAGKVSAQSSGWGEVEGSGLLVRLCRCVLVSLHSGVNSPGLSCELGTGPSVA